MLAPPLQNNWCFFERSYTWKICKGQLPLYVKLTLRAM